MTILFRHHPAIRGSLSSDVRNALLELDWGADDMNGTPAKLIKLAAPSRLFLPLRNRRKKVARSTGENPQGIFYCFSNAWVHPTFQYSFRSEDESKSTYCAKHPKARLSLGRGAYRKQFRTSGMFSSTKPMTKLSIPYQAIAIGGRIRVRRFAI